MTFTEEYYELENRARGFICEKLDEKNEIIFYNIEEDDYTDEFYDLPSQLVESRHRTAFHYYIFKIFKHEEEYFVRGYENEEGDVEDFNLFKEVDCFNIVIIADKLKEI